jgi:hypothetical protein
MIPAVATVIGALSAQLVSVEIGKPNLEDVFIHLSGRPLR